MEQAKKSNRTVDELVVFRARMLLFAAFSMALWQGGWLATDIVQKSSVYAMIFTIITITGAICWLITTALFLKFNREMKTLNACDALHDELTQQNRNLSIFKSYFCLLGLIWLSIPLMNWWHWDSFFVLRGVAMIALVMPMLFFAIAELKLDMDAE